MASPAEVRSLFEKRLKEMNKTAEELFHPWDLKRIHDDIYIQRVLDFNKNNAEKSALALAGILKWRKEIGANDINESSIRMDYVREGMIFPQGRDVDGRLLLILKFKMHVKGQRDFEEIKKILIYWLDRIEREENGKEISIFFDMDGAGLSNMDIDLIKYLILLFEEYYPMFLNYIIVYNLPWMLNAAFKIVKSILPAEAVERLKVVKKDTLKTVVTSQQALKCWGGQNDYQFVFESEKSSERKTVTFAEDKNQHVPGEMLRISPREIIFNSENGETAGEFVLGNMAEGKVLFKIRTTSPEKYRVKPSSGVLDPSASQTVVVSVLNGYQVASVIKDRFLVMSVQKPEDVTQKELSEIWTSGSKIDEYRLKCQLPEKEVKLEKNQSNDIYNVVTDLQDKYDTLHQDVKMMFRLQIFTLFLIVISVFLCFTIYRNVHLHFTLKDSANNEL